MRASELATLRFTGGYWLQLETINREQTIPANFRQCTASGRFAAWNFDYRRGQPNGPHIFWDSDIAKYLEAGACSLAKFPDPELEQAIDELIDRLVRAQAPDGYFNSYFQQIRPLDRWSNLRGDHELYCAGHLFEAAVAYFYATGKRKFLDAMCRYADLLVRSFGPGPEQCKGYPGHEELELALVKLAAATGCRDYLELARFFVDQRGTEPNYFQLEAGGKPSSVEVFNDLAYFQAHRPVREQSEATGHAVRAVYLYTAMADLARETGDQELTAACHRLWRSITREKMYVTGGIGSTHFGEAFAAPFDLPNEEAYAETCAAIGLIFFAWRMFLLEKKGEYLDVLERALYNAAAAGTSVEGTRFFYVNPLACQPGATLANGRHPEPRPDWFGCSCCPPNVARLRASVGQYFYELDDNRLWINLYNDSRWESSWRDRPLTIEQRTAYPWQGRIELLLHDWPEELTLSLRIPGYARSYRLLRNGGELPHALVDGFAVASTPCRAGDRLTLELEFEPQLLVADPRVRQDCGRVAVSRGPLLYCLEEEDNGPGLNTLTLDPESPLQLREAPGLPAGTVMIEGQGFREPPFEPDAPLYRPWRPETPAGAVLRFVPYALWGNRRFGEMLLWVRLRG